MGPIGRIRPIRPISTGHRGLSPATGSVPSDTIGQIGPIGHIRPIRPISPGHQGQSPGHTGSVPASPSPRHRVPIPCTVFSMRCPLRGQTECSTGWHHALMQFSNNATEHLNGVQNTTTATKATPAHHWGNAVKFRSASRADWHVACNGRQGREEAGMHMLLWMVA